MTTEVPLSDLSVLASVLGTDELVISRDGAELLRVTVDVLLADTLTASLINAPNGIAGLDSGGVLAAPIPEQSTDDVVDLSGLAQDSPPTATGALLELKDRTDSVLSGAYSPTVTGVSNVDSVGSSSAIWIRVGNHVTVTGEVSINATSLGVSTNVGISLPVASNLAGLDLFGQGLVAPGGATVGGVYIAADAANNRANLIYEPLSTGDELLTFHFSYVVI